MNKYKKYLLTFGFVIMTGLLQPLTINAQPSDPGCDPLDPACPIDGGLGLLIVAGITIGAKKAYDLQKKELNKI